MSASLKRRGTNKQRAYGRAICAVQMCRCTPKNKKRAAIRPSDFPDQPAAALFLRRSGIRDRNPACLCFFVLGIRSRTRACVCSFPEAFRHQGSKPCLSLFFCFRNQGPNPSLRLTVPRMALSAAENISSVTATGVSPSCTKAASSAFPRTVSIIC